VRLALGTSINNVNTVAMKFSTAMISFQCRPIRNLFWEVVSWNGLVIIWAVVLQKAKLLIP